MKEQPTLITERLILRPYSSTDAKDIQRLIGERVVSDTLLNVPYPYEDNMAEDFMSKSKAAFEEGKSAHFAVTHREQGYFIGGIGLNDIDQTRENAEVGYWIGKPYWRNSYCTEAARTVVKYGFEALDLNRIYATHFTRNPASGRVMQKIGMKHEGHMRQAWKHWGKFEDGEQYAILRSDFKNLST